MTPDNCPHCGTDQRGDPIPAEHLAAGLYGEPDSAPRHYSRTIGVNIPGVYDGVLYWACPDCGGTWHRWPEGHHLRRRAQPWIHPAGTPAGTP